MVRGRISGYKEHPTRKDLKTVLLRSVTIRIPGKIREGVALNLDHLWFLDRHLRGLGIRPRINSIVHFAGSVYSYQRLSQSSQRNGKYDTIDYAILPVCTKN